MEKKIFSNMVEQGIYCARLGLMRENPATWEEIAESFNLPKNECQKIYHNICELIAPELVSSFDGIEDPRIKIYKEEFDRCLKREEEFKRQITALTKENKMLNHQIESVLAIVIPPWTQLVAVEDRMGK